jgi:hypothetical protein
VKPPIVSAVPDDRARPSALPRAAAAVCGALVVLGLVAFLGGLASDAPTAWRAFHVNTLFWAGLAQGGVVLAAIFVIVGAGWPGPVRRVAESLSAWVPVTFVLAAIGFLGRDHVYPWIHEPIPAKAAWLNVPRLVITDLAIFGVMALLTWMFLRASLRPALHGADAEASGLARGLIQRWTAGWRGDAEERAASERRLRVLAPILCMAFGVGYSVIGFDMVMSLSPTWFSNLFGAYFAWGGFLSAVSVTALISVLHRDHPGLEGEFTRSRFHDLGKMVFAFSIFWMYLFFSQYLIIWYGNLPEETSFIEARLGAEFLQSTASLDLVNGTALWWENVTSAPWVRVTLFTWVLVWVIPFWLLLGQDPKRTGWFLGSVATISAFGFWMERNVLIWPSLAPQDTWAFLGWIQVGVALGFLGAFALVFLLFTRVFPSLPVPRRG